MNKVQRTIKEARLVELQEKLRDPNGAGKWVMDDHWAFPRIRARIEREITKLQQELLEDDGRTTTQEP